MRHVRIVSLRRVLQPAAEAPLGWCIARTASTCLARTASK
ncbi:hypothetical protein PLANPX_1961 [Lacipirellula parvula]|uniref:Uncharacterized protein n=1 Tax=Lacipirellula parvula TaxID=2650471 RepID=A0A5K7XHB3_9BACT|nr:hypothetical protein PLANPX_1961 [Lacipirellula parvula]